MKLSISNIKDILNEKLTLKERGILITILLLKDVSPKLTLAKVKATIQFKDVKEELIHLHEAAFIEWSGYKNAKKTLDLKTINPQVIEVIDFMNDLCGLKINPKTESATVNLINRLSENSIDDVKLVIANRYSEWKDDPFMRKYLTPYTIFRPSKFDKYLEEALRTKQGKRLVEAVKINLKPGDEITYELSKKLVDEDLYTIKIFSITGGEKTGNGILARKHGGDIKKAMKILNNKTKSGEIVDIKYYYKEN
jgi:uncharacterized phage protein (TIGR02220 family)